MVFILLVISLTRFFISSVALFNAFDMIPNSFLLEILKRLVKSPLLREFANNKILLSTFPVEEARILPKSIAIVNPIIVIKIIAIKDDVYRALFLILLLLEFCTVI